MSSLAVFKSPRPRWSTQAQGQLVTLLAALTHPEESYRDGALKGIRMVADDRILSAVADGLIAALNGQDAGFSRRVTDALIALGPAVSPRLVLALEGPGAVAFHEKVADVLTALVPVIPETKRLSLILDLQAALAHAKGQRRVRACSRVLGALCDGNQRLDATGQPSEKEKEELGPASTAWRIEFVENHLRGLARGRRSGKDVEETSCT